MEALIVILTKKKTAELITYLTYNLLPTTQAIIKQVIDLQGISYTVPGMTKWLYRNDFSDRKSVGIPHKFKDIYANLAEKPFRLTILIVPVSLESKNRLLISQ